MYNKNNIFAKIIKGEVSCSKLYEDEYIIAIKDINPVAPVHILVIPKGGYEDFADFTEKASEKEIAHYFKKIADIAKENEADEYRIISNKGEFCGQTIFHFHTHIIAGKKISNLI